MLNTRFKHPYRVESGSESSEEKDQASMNKFVFTQCDQSTEIYEFDETKIFAPKGSIKI